jgi:hypothetical protein
MFLWSSRRKEMEMRSSLHFLLVFFLMAGLLVGCATTPSQEQLADSIQAYREGNVQKFIQMTKKAYETDPNDPYVINNMGVVNELEGNRTAALAKYKEAAQKAGDRMIRYSQSDKDQGKLLRVVAQENYDNLMKKK